MCVALRLARARPTRAQCRSQRVKSLDYSLPSTVAKGLAVGVGWKQLLAPAERARDYKLIITLTSTAATSTSVTPTAATAATTEASHLGKARINLLLGLLEDIDEITRLLLV